MVIEWLGLVLLVILSIAIVSFVQFALCHLNFWLFKFVLIIILAIGWIWAEIFSGMSKSFLDPGLFSMMVVTPFSVIGISIGWVAYYAQQGHKRNKK